MTLRRTLWRLIRTATLAVLAVIAAYMASPAAAMTLASAALPFPASVTGVRQVGARVYANAGRWFRLTHCEVGKICAEPEAPPEEAIAPGGIPAGKVASGPGRGFVHAWYSEPTARYDHGVLGDAIEAGAIVAVDDKGGRHSVRLDDRAVFEDLTPRIADLDGDGLNEIIAIRSGLASGAAIVVYGLRNGAMTEIAATRPIGVTHRWLNIAGIGDFTGDGSLDVAIVRTPHLGGRLEILTLKGGRLRRVAVADGFSNHALGSTEMGMSAIADVDGDGVADLILPDAKRSALRVVSVNAGRLKTIGEIDLGFPIVTAIAALSADGPAFVMGLSNGHAVIVRGGSLKAR